MAITTEMADLDEAEAWLRASCDKPRHRALAELLMTEYDKRGRAVLDGFYERAALRRELDAARAELERREGATLNSELKAHAADPRLQRWWDHQLSDAGQAERDALRARVEAEES